jgi:cysteine synthase A
MREITTELGGDIDYLFCSTSTCGTMRGCAEYIRDYNLKTKKIAVDALGSVIFGSENAKRLIPGHGASVRPRLYQPDIADDYVLVTDLDCIIGCRELVRHEAILAGGSSGGVISAVKHRLPELEPGATCVVILPDRGERYLDTIYSEEWVMRHFGNTPSLWKEPVEANQCLAMTY